MDDIQNKLDAEIKAAAHERERCREEKGASERGGTARFRNSCKESQSKARGETREVQLQMRQFLRPRANSSTISSTQRGKLGRTHESSALRRRGCWTGSA
mmetsp:Transcript_31971/g.78440  ORF Transcript_31971/g.78440 Transcript_31971/m.78440 type:complete len:100 (-) Transcript_31971:569-868(-)